jgi:hypothetical protein
MDMHLEQLLHMKKHAILFLLPCSRYTLWQKAELSSSKTPFSRRECFGAPGVGSKESFFSETRRVVYLVATFIQMETSLKILL